MNSELSLLRIPLKRTLRDILDRILRAFGIIGGILRASGRSFGAKILDSSCLEHNERVLSRIMGTYLGPSWGHSECL